MWHHTRVIPPIHRHFQIDARPNVPSSLLGKICPPCRHMSFARHAADMHCACPARVHLSERCPNLRHPRLVVRKCRTVHLFMHASADNTKIKFWDKDSGELMCSIDYRGPTSVAFMRLQVAEKLKLEKWYPITIVNDSGEPLSGRLDAGRAAGIRLHKRRRK